MFDIILPRFNLNFFIFKGWKVFFKFFDPNIIPRFISPLQS
jgi:hypothetical protein